jgi:hypothetical protein
VADAAVRHRHRPCRLCAGAAALKVAAAALSFRRDFNLGEWNLGSAAALFRHSFNCTRVSAMLTTILIVILVLALIGSLPTWGYSRSWGYGPGGGLGLILIIIIVLALMGHI